MREINLKTWLALLLGGILSINLVWTNTVFANTNKVQKEENTVLKSLGSYKTYNAVAFGDYEVEQADMEGKLAVKGNFIGPTKANSFDIAAAYEGNTIITGGQILDKTNPVFLLAGDYQKATGKTVNVLSGYGVTKSKAISDKFTVGIKGLGMIERTESEILETFNQITKDINQKIDITSKIKAGDKIIKNNANFELAEGNNSIITNKLGRDLIDLDIKGTTDEGGVFRIPNLDNHKGMIFYSTAKSINFNSAFFYEVKNDDGSYKSIGPIDSKNPVMKDIASKIIWIFPNATEINTKATDVVGSVIAPKAEVTINSGAINGQVFANKIHQKGGGEIHNFLFNWDIIDKIIESEPPIKPEPPVFGVLEITKVDSENDKTFLAGAEFEIKDSGRFVVASGETDKNGVAEFGKLKQGKYTYKETKAPEGYILDDKEYEFTIDEKGSVVTKKVENTKKEIPPIKPEPPITPELPVFGVLEITKVDSENNKTFLAGAEFEIKDSSGFVVASGETDKNGVAEFGKLKQGKYTYKETKAPEGYILDDKEYEFTIDEKGSVVTKQVENTKKGKPINPVNPEKPEKPTNPPVKPVNPVNPGKYPQTSDKGFKGSIAILIVSIVGLFIVNKRKY